MFQDGEFVGLWTEYKFDFHFLSSKPLIVHFSHNIQGEEQDND